MANISKKEIARYCYDIVLGAIQYSNDANKWSPNNIRRLILSPDGVAVQLHTGKSFIQKPFNKEKACRCFSEEGYKPMITTLVNRICSSVEEIILCTGSANGLYLPQSELELRSVIASNKVNYTEEHLLTNIKARFVRLRAIIIANCTIVDVLSKYGNYMSDHMFQLADIDEVRNTAQVIDIHTNDWYKGYYFRPKDYPFDKDGGILYSTLHKIEDSIEKQKHDKVVADNKDKRLKDYLLAVNISEQKLLKILNAYKDIASLVGNCDFVCIFGEKYKKNTLTSSLVSVIRKYQIVNYEKVLSIGFINTLNKIGIKISDDSNKTIDTRDGLKLLASQLDSIFLELYVSLCDNFLDIVLMSGSIFPIMTKVKLKQYDRVIYIPPQLSDKASQVNEFFEEPLKGLSINDSIANICGLISFLLLSDAGKNGSTIKKYYKKQSWLDKYKNVEVQKNA